MSRRPPRSTRSDTLLPDASLFRAFGPAFLKAEGEMFAHFRDVLVSGEVRLTKPDPAIYRLALERFDLRADTALFVDDRQDNVDSATTLGMRAHLFRDAASLRAGLRAVGLLARSEGGRGGKEGVGRC